MPRETRTAVRSRVGLVSVLALVLGVVTVQNSYPVESASGTEECSSYSFTNGLLGFGGDNQSNSSFVYANSIEPNGMLKQPFYLSGSTSPNKWFKLTHGVKPLDIAIGHGSSGQTWPTSNVEHVTAPVSATSTEIDASGFLEEGESGGVCHGFGTLKTTTALGIADSKQVTVEHTYSLGETDSYVQISTTVINNRGAGDLSNFQVWVGTRDDYVGSDDGPVKTRGNLVDGAFEAVQNTGDDSSALLISSGAESVLFFSTTENTSTSHASCCSFSNAYNRNPASNPTTTDGDGSYALFLPVGNLADGARASMTWFYAAGATADLADVVAAVAAAAGGAGSLDGATTQGGSLAYSVDFDGVTTADETHHVVVVDGGSTASTDAQIAAGSNYGDVTVRYAANDSTSPTAATFAITGLTESSDYTYYVVTQYDDEDSDIDGRYSEITSGNFVTLPGTPVVSSVTAGNGEVTVVIEPSAGEQNFEYSTDAWETSTVRSPSATTSPWVITGLTNGTEYSFQFRSVYEGQDGAPTSTFTATPRPPAVFLSGLALSEGTLSPAFAPSTLSYAASVSNATAGLTLTPTSAGKAIQVDSVATVSGEESGEISLAEGANTIPISVVSNETGALATEYTIVVTRAAVVPVARGGGAPAVTPPPAVVVPPRALPRTSVVPAPTVGPVVRANPSAPAPNQPTATVGGQARVLQTQVSGSNSVSLRSGSFSIGLNVQPGQGSIRQDNGGSSAELAVRSGGSTAFSGSGVMPGSTVQVFIPRVGGDSREVGRMDVDATGSFSGDALFGVRPGERPMPIGRQVMQVVSVDASGQQAVVEMAVNIAQPAPAPEMDRALGQAPELRPGQLVATNAGDSELVTVTPQPDQKQATIEGDSWSMSFSIPGDGGSVAESDDGEVMVEFIRNETAAVAGSGFMPGTRADVWLFSDPTLLGSVTIDDNGEFNGEVNVDGNVVTVGEHTLQLQGVGDDGFVRSANLGVVVNDEAPLVATEEAATSFLWAFWLAGGLAAVAAAGLGWQLRRRVR